MYIKRIITHIVFFVFCICGGNSPLPFLLSQVHANSPFTFTITQNNNWGSGFCFQFNVQNTSSNPVSNWVIGFDLNGGTMTSSFGGVFTNSGSSYEIRSPGTWADPLAVGQTLSMGLCGNGNGVVSNLELKSYAGSSGGGGPPPPGSILQDYNFTFQGVQVDVNTSSNWSGGYCRDITITNNGGQVINGWQLDFTLDQSLSSSYSGNFSQNSTSHTITPLSWNQNINPAQSFVLGFCSNGTKYDYDWILTVNGLSSPINGILQNIIGTGSVIGTGAFDSTIHWDENFPGTASGKVQNILIKARVQPTLNMSFSTGTIDLGVLTAGVAASGSLFIEIGTNAKSGVSITARSQSGGLTNTADVATQINNLTTDGLAESYTWGSTPNVTDDSSVPTFAAQNTSGANPLSAVPQVNGNIIEYNVYTTNKSEALNLVDDVKFTVNATAGAETPAGTYEDRVTFTVTGNF